MDVNDDLGDDEHEVVVTEVPGERDGTFVLISNEHYIYNKYKPT